MSFSQWVANKFDFICLLEDYKRPLVLCIDELDKLLRPELPNKATSQQQALWKIKVQRLPRMERKEDMQFLNEYGFTLTEAVLCGFIPAQLIDFHIFVFSQAPEMKIDRPSYTVEHLPVLVLGTTLISIFLLLLWIEGQMSTTPKTNTTYYVSVPFGALFGSFTYSALTCRLHLNTCVIN